jgi:hypothetical protein
MKLKLPACLLFACAALNLAPQQSSEKRGQLIFRVADKYEVYAYEEKLLNAVERKYTYAVDGIDAGYDLVYLCGDSQSAAALLLAFLDELAQTGSIEERAFNVMGMKLYTVQDAAFISEVLFMQHEEQKWRVSSSRTLRRYYKELAQFRRRYEYF